MSATLVAAKLADLAERVAMVRKHRLDGAQAYASSPEARDLVAFNLMLAVQTAADVATHILASSGAPPASSVADGFERLTALGVISAELAANLRKAVGFCNLVAHGYTKLNLTQLHEAAQRGVDDLESFAMSAARWASGS